MTPKRLILVDGSSYLYRAFHAMPALVNSKGMPTGAIYGVVNMLRKLLTDYEPEHIVVVFDAKGKTFRDDLYDKYKATRHAMPAELVQQIEPLHAIIHALGLPLLMIEGVEADDVIGTLAKDAAAKGIPSLISTGDKDLAQLVDESITLVNTMTNTVLNPESVKAKFGVPPTLIIDYLTLIGDTSDNIPGVPQVGPKTAAKWLQQYGSLDKLIAEAHTISGKVGENLRGALGQLPLTKQLVTIKLDVSLPLSFSDLQRKTPDKMTLRTHYQTLEFKTWLAEILEKNPSSSQETATAYEIILTETQLTDCVQKLKQAKCVAFHSEANDPNYMNAQIVGLSFSLAAGKAMYIPLAHDYPGAPNQLNRTTVLDMLKPLFENPHLQKIGHNLKYQKEILANHGIQLQGLAFDTLLEAYVLESANTNYHLEGLALKFLGKRILPYQELVGKGAKQIPFNHVPLEQAAVYIATVADMALQLHETLWPKFETSPGLKHIFTQIEMPLVSVLSHVERNGVLIDAALLHQQSIELEQRLMALEKEAYRLANQVFNLNSPKQLQEILFTQLQLPVLQKTPTGQASTADAILQELALEYPLPKIIIEYRSLSKLISTYTKRLPEQINSQTGRVHTSYHQTGAATGRLSSSDPNLQNIPVRTAEGRRIRQAFVAPSKFKMISADYSQIELRIMAHMSDDPALLRAFANNLDIHEATAAEVLGIPLDKVSYEERRSAKAINFGLIYGMSAFGLAKQLGLDRQAAQRYIDLYFTRYPGVKAYMERTRTQAHKQGYVETLSGRRLYLPEINSSQMMRQKAAERAAINAPLQGTAADIIKRAMISLDAWLESHSIEAKMVMQVHDELVFEVAYDAVDDFIPVIREHMMQAAELKVPLLVDVRVGDNWDE